MDGAVADAVRGELKPALNGCAHHLLQAILGNEPDSPVSRVNDPVHSTDTPRFAHISAAGEHAAIQVGLDADDAQQRVFIPEQRVACDFLNLLPNLCQITVRTDMIGKSDPHGGLSAVSET